MELRIVPALVAQESSSHALLESHKLKVTFHKSLFWLNWLLFTVQNTFIVTEQINNQTVLQLYVKKTNFIHVDMLTLLLRFLGEKNPKHLNTSHLLYCPGDMVSQS